MKSFKKNKNKKSLLNPYNNSYLEKIQIFLFNSRNNHYDNKINRS